MESKRSAQDGATETEPFPIEPDDGPDIGSVVVLAGVSCSGKTTLLKRIRSGDRSMLPELPPAFDLADCDYLNAMDLVSPGEPPGPESRVASGRTLLLHYDLFRPITFYGELDLKLDPVLSVLRHASDVVVLNVWDEPRVLRSRASRRRRGLWRKLLQRPVIGRSGSNLGEFRGARRRRLAMRPWFADPDRLWQVHAAWFEWCRAAGITRHWVARPSRDERFVRLSLDGPVAPFWPISAARAEGRTEPLSDPARAPGTSATPAA